MPKQRLPRPEYITKQGEHGTLYLHRIVYRNAGQDDHERFTTRLYGYDKEHAIDRFYETATDEGFTPVSISRAQHLRHRETVEPLE